MKDAIFLCNYGSSDIFTCEDTCHLQVLFFLGCFSAAASTYCLKIAILLTFSQHSDGSTCYFGQQNDRMVEWQKFT